MLAALSLASLIEASAAAGPALAAGEAEAPACVVRAQTWDSTDFECVLAPVASPGRYRFTASFSGGHDDTLATMTASRDGAPAACDAGSKTRLQGEDGDVSLECLLTVVERAGMPPTLGFRVAWSHAQFVAARLVRALPLSTEAGDKAVHKP